MEIFLVIIGAVLLAAGITGFTVAFKRLGRITSLTDAAIRPNQALLGISFLASAGGLLPLALGATRLIIDNLL
jgi:hypothetical protein